MSDEVFVIQNQLGQFWTRAGEWVDGREPQRVLKTKHRDEAVNQLVELSAKDIDLRGEVLACELDERKEPVIEASAHQTPSLADKAAEKAAERSAAKAAEKAARAEEDQEEQKEQTATPQDDTEAVSPESAGDDEEPPLSAAV